MIHNLPQLKLEELHELFLCETKHFLEGLEKNIPHNELAAIRHTIKQVMAEIEKRKKVKC